jgi:hypothetical protein
MSDVSHLEPRLARTVRAGRRDLTAQTGWHGASLLQAADLHGGPLENGCSLQFAVEG